MLQRFLDLFHGLPTSIPISTRANAAATLAAAGQATQLYETEAGDVLSLYGLRKRLQPSTNRWDAAPEEEIIQLFGEVSKGFVRKI